MTEPEHAVPVDSAITMDGYIGTIDWADWYRMEATNALAVVSARGPVAVREELINMEKLEELAE